ncbi:MAPEG family protein [Agaribacterium sp. ZY112]|uniref:MAPEG family protein n=1 Tax=Agaribacterium sp. ZY112 TaxID=3233574 RepID=UPI003525F9A4
MTNLNPDIFWLTLTILMTSLFWVPYIINRMYEHGVWSALYNPQPDTRPKAQWAERMMKAHENAIENLVLFSTLVLTVEILQIGSHTTALACAIYFFSRLAHFTLYSLRVPLLRTITFLIGWICQIVIGLSILRITW